jgi:hypothetical protein
MEQTTNRAADWNVRLSQAEPQCSVPAAQQLPTAVYSEGMGTLERSWRCGRLNTQSVSGSTGSAKVQSKLNVPTADPLVLQKCSTKRPELEV